MVGSDITHCRPLYLCKILGLSSFSRGLLFCAHPVDSGSADFRNVTRTSLSKDVSYASGKIYMKIRSVFPQICAKLWKMLYLATLKNPLKIPGSGSR